MKKSKWLNSLLALLVVFISFSAFTGDFEDEEDLIKTANKHFSKGEYAQCVELFSQLVSNHPQDPNYNFKYGTCLLFSTEDKEQAIRFLKFSINKGDVDPEASFFYGRALHLNYQFSKAKAQYIKFRSIVKPKVSTEKNISAYIAQCSSAERLIYDIKKINVIHKKKVSKSEFFRSYRLGSMERSIIVKPEEFQTKGDKKAGEYSLIVHNAMNEVIYVSGYSKKDGIGGKDIFKIQKMPDGTFSEPINIGPKINTPQDEDFPYLHPNGRVLYFASKGHNSIGGYDIFRSELDTLVNLWGNAVNVGFAVNSPDDDVLYVSDMDENIAYFASSRENKLGEITVYKILPNNNDVPAVIVRGEILIKGSNQNKAEVVVYNEAGEEVGVYTSKQQSGAFTMTLEESSTFLIGISTPGKTEKKVKLIVPAKKDESIISKKFVIENGQLTLIDNSILLENEENKKKIIAESAILKVNQTTDLEFNTKIKEKVLKEIPSEEEIDNNEKEFIDEKINLITSAQEELDEIKDASKKLNKQTDATYFVAQKKKIKSSLIKDEIEELSGELTEAYSNSEKEIKRATIFQKQRELRIITAEAVTAIEFAEVKEKELKIKSKEIEFAEAYLSAVKKAEKSNNSLVAIAAIEKAKENLAAIQGQIKTMKDDDGTAKTYAKIEEAKKNVNNKELAFSLVDSDIIDIEREKKDLADQAKSTRNKVLKEELMLQVNELVEERKYKFIEKDLANSALIEAKSELEVLESLKNVFSEINEEAASKGLVMMSENQKTKIQEEVALVEKEIKANNKINNQDLINDKKIIGQEEDVAFENNSVNDINNTIEKETSSAEFSDNDNFSNDLNKVKLKNQNFESLREEKELLELSLNGPRNTKEKKEIKDKIKELSALEFETLKELNAQVSKLKKQEKLFTDEDRNSYSLKIEELSSLEDNITEYEKTQNNLKATERVDQNQKPITEEIVFDVETATDSELKQIVSDQTNIITYDFSSNNNLFGEEDKIKEISKLNKEAIFLLKESNLAEIESDKTGNNSSFSADKLKEKAIEKLFLASAIEGRVNAKVFSSNREIIENEISRNKDISTDVLQTKAKKVSDLWVKASLMRSVSDENKDKTKRVELINKAGALEREALDLQMVLSSEIQSSKNSIALLETEKVNNLSLEGELILTSEASIQEDVLSKSNSTKEDSDNDNVLLVDELISTSEASIQKDVLSKSNSTKEDSDIDDVVLVDELISTSEASIQEDVLSKSNSTKEDSDNDDVLLEGELISTSEASIQKDVLSKSNSTKEDSDNVYLKGELISTSEASIQKDVLNKSNSTNEDGYNNKLSSESEIITISQAITNESISNSSAEKDSLLIIKIASEKTKLSIDENIDFIANYEKGQLSEKEILIGNKEGYGIERETSFVYGPSSKTKLELAKGNKLERQAIDYYYQALKLEKLALNSDPENKNKLKKEASKLLNKGRKYQVEANIQYQKVNEAEIKYNEGEIAFALEYEDIVKSDSAKLLSMEANELFAQALLIRKKASKEKDYKKSSELVNQAYSLELKAIRKQNYVITGELDAECEEESVDVVTKSIKKEENQYTYKADDLRLSARKELDNNKKKALLAEARRYELAGNTNRTNRIVSELNTDQITYKNNQVFMKIARKQSNNNIQANKAYDFELEADSLFSVANVLRVQSSENSNQVSRMDQIEEAKELMAEAQESQNLAISKYQESKFTPNTSNFTPKFREDKEKEIAEENNGEEGIIELASNFEGEENNFVKINKEGLKVQDVILEEESFVETESVKNDIDKNNESKTSVKIISDPVSVRKVRESYNALASNANKIEKQEVARIARIEILNKQSSDNKNKSEELLSKVDAMDNETEIMKTIAEANTYRNKAEEQEVESDNEEIILKNNLAERASMRKEAILTLEVLNPDIRKEILLNDENSSPEFNKINEFIAKENKEISTLNSIDLIDPVNNVIIDKKITNKATKENVSIVENEIKANNDLVVNLEDVKILGEGSVEELQDEDKFEFNKQETYSTKYSIPVDNEMPKGIVYQVQVGAFRNSIDPAIFNGLSPLVGERTSSGIIRYKVGCFRGFKSANMAKGRIRNLGYRDAFVVVFFDGKRITIPEAKYVIDNAEESEKFVYENLVLDEVEKLKQLGLTEEEGKADPIDVSKSPIVVSTIVDIPKISINNGLANNLLNVGGVFFTVQVGVFRLPKISSDLYGVSPLLTEKINNGLLRYSTGVFRNYSSADSRKIDVRNQGVKDAFVIAYNGESKISTKDAKLLLQNDSGNVSTEGSINITFKVQVGAYKVPIDVENTPVFKDLTAYSISRIKRPSGILIYMVGSYENKAEADDLKQVVIAAGVADCFVIALQDGKRIAMKKALDLLSNK